MTPPPLETLFSQLAPVSEIPERHPLVEGFRQGTLSDLLRPVVSRFGSWLDGVTDPLSCRSEVGARLLRCQRSFLKQLREPVPLERGPLQESAARIEALGREGRRFLPEIVGITYVHGRLWQMPELVQLCRPLLERFPKERVGRGIALWLREHDLWWRRFREGESELPRRLLQKARYGIGHHRHVRFAGRSLDEWLSDLVSGRNREAFLERLPALLPCLRRASRFGGPMFGVFSEEELEGLARSLPLPNVPPKGEASPREGGPPERFSRLSPRALYHRLLVAPDSRVLAAASGYVERLLRKASGNPPCSPEHFSSWIDRRYAEALSPPPARVPRLPRELYLFLLEQFAPFVLIDGCWLLASARIARRFPEVGKRLFQIYFEELGGGEPSRHHGNLYRGLLLECAIELPEPQERAFVDHPRFLSRAFDLPALLLSIGHLPERFLPELLGLNLAIELSGLGATYRDLARDFDFWGIDAQIVRLHQAIDNPATGHTALAREAIELFLEGAPDEESRRYLWRRVWNGYRLFGVALRPFLLQLALVALRRYGIAILKLRWRRAGERTERRSS